MALVVPTCGAHILLSSKMASRSVSETIKLQAPVLESRKMRDNQLNSLNTLIAPVAFAKSCSASSASRTQDNGSPTAPVDQLASGRALIPLNGFRLTIPD